MHAKHHREEREKEHDIKETRRVEEKAEGPNLEICMEMLFCTWSPLLAICVPRALSTAHAPLLLCYE